MRLLSATSLIAVLISVPAVGQRLNLDLGSIAAKASDKTELSLDGAMLSMLKMAVSKKVGPENQGLYSGVEQISLRSYEFAKDGEYSDRDLEGLRKQVSTANGWSRMLGAKDEDGNTEIYIHLQGDKVGGFLLIAAEPKELTIIQVSGSIQLAQVQELINSTIQYKGETQ